MRPNWKLPFGAFVLGAICSVIPDLDVIGFRFGVRYGDLLGHRGFTHSLFFAAAVSLLGTLLVRQLSAGYAGNRLQFFSFLFVCTASHGFLDAFTNGGLGVAFFSPFSNQRCFFPWRPLEVSPIGIADFLSGPGLQVLRSELLFVWLPCAAIFILSTAFRKKSGSNHEDTKKR